MTPEETAQRDAATDAVRGIVGEALVALYLHGSAVAGGLRPQSDIDLLAVVDRSLTDAERARLLAALLRLSGVHPAVSGRPRCLEVMAFRLSDLAAGTYPARADFTYGEWLRAGFEAGGRAAPTRDPEHTLLLAQARQEAIPLLGPPASELLPPIPPHRVRQAIRDALPPLLAGLHGDERNVLLTLARMWCTGTTGAFATKDAAALWAIPRLPAAEAATLRHARAAYLGEEADDWAARRDQAERLAGHLHRRIAAAP